MTLQRYIQNPTVSKQSSQKLEKGIRQQYGYRTNMQKRLKGCPKRIEKGAANHPDRENIANMSPKKECLAWALLFLGMLGMSIV